jgi:hypothetical protein
MRVTAEALLNADMHTSSLRPDEGLKFMEHDRHSISRF